MTGDGDNSGELHPHLVIGAWAGTLLGGRRVALLGDASTGLAEQIAAASGRRVHAYDPEPQRLAAAIARGRKADVAFASVEEAFDARANAFDAVVVPDLSSFDDQAALVAGAAAMLSGRGLLILASPHESAGGGTPSYYELYDLVTAELDEVHMIGVAPFVGYTLADFAAEGEPPVTVDTALAEAEEPLLYVVVAGRTRASVDPYTLLQVPTASGLRWLGATEPSAGADDARVEAERETERAWEAERDDLRRQLDAVTDKAKRNAKDAQDRTQRLAQLSSRLSEVQTELERTRERLERRAHRAEQRAEQLERELEASRAEYDNAREALEDTHQEDLDRMLERIADLEAEAEQVETKRASQAPPEDGGRSLETLRSQMSELETALGEARSERHAERRKVAELTAQLAAARASAKPETTDRGDFAREVEQDLARDLSRLEERLKERGRIVAELTAQIRQSQLVGRELVRELERARAAQGRDGAAKEIAALEAELDALRQTCTRQEADLEAARWRLSHVEREASEEEPSSDVVKLEAALQASREELATLRRELEARRASESAGEGRREAPR